MHIYDVIIGIIIDNPNSKLNLILQIAKKFMKNHNIINYWIYIIFVYYVLYWKNIFYGNIIYNDNIWKIHKYVNWKMIW